MDSDDSSLVTRALAGDTSVQEDLVRQYRVVAYNTALQLVGNREDALDIAHEAMVRFLRTLGRLDRSRPVRPWVYQIVRNLVRDRRRRQALRRADSLETLVAEGTFEPADRALNPEAQAIRRDLQRRLSAALAGLTEQQREVVVLRDYQDLSYLEIAEILGIPRGTVMSRLHAARTRLREILRDSGALGSAPATGGGDGARV
jgi:RNA polymerase sigma-70 factor (ECF subfamily)